MCVFCPNETLLDRKCEHLHNFLSLNYGTTFRKPGLKVIPVLIIFLLAFFN